MVCLVDRLYMGRYGYNKRRCLLFPFRPDRRDIYDLAKRIMVAYRFVFLFVPDGKDRAVRAGIVNQIAAYGSSADLGQYLFYPSVVV